MASPIQNLYFKTKLTDQQLFAGGSFLQSGFFPILANYRRKSGDCRSSDLEQTDNVDGKGIENTSIINLY